MSENFDDQLYQKIMGRIKTQPQRKRYLAPLMQKIFFFELPLTFRVAVFPMFILGILIGLGGFENIEVVDLASVENCSSHEVFVNPFCELSVF